jgi:hypothetical protein
MSLVGPSGAPVSSAKPATAPADVKVAVEEIIEVDTAFLVFRTTDGRTIVSPNIDLSVVPQRTPTTHDVRGMCANAADDALAQALIPGIAQAVLGQLQMAGQQQQQRQLSPDEQAALRRSMGL